MIKISQALYAALFKIPDEFKSVTKNAILRFTNDNNWKINASCAVSRMKMSTKRMRKRVKKMVIKQHVSLLY